MRADEDAWFEEDDWAYDEGRSSRSSNRSSRTDRQAGRAGSSRSNGARTDRSARGSRSDVNRGGTTPIRIDWAAVTSRGGSSARGGNTTRQSRSGGYGAYGAYSGYGNYDEYAEYGEYGEYGYSEFEEYREEPRRQRSTRGARRDAGNENPRNDRSSRESKAQASDNREARRRERAKARADRMFDKQFQDSAPATEAEGAPRAALYEGKMGASHRKSARMQQASSAMPQMAKINPAGWFSNINVSPWVLRMGTFVLCFVLVGVFLYTPAQQYYQAQRERDRLAAEYTLLEERNDALSAQTAALSSNAGMEDAVRQKYGYVVAGDQSAIVAGLSDVTTDTSRNSQNIEANVLSSAVKAPEEWYTPYLDAFFGVA